MRVIVGLALLILLQAFAFSDKSAAREVLRFQGNLDCLNKTLDVDFDFGEKRIMHVSGKSVNNQTFRVTIGVEHFQTQQFEFSSNIVGGWRVINDKQCDCTVIQGEANSHFSLVDYQPIRDLTAMFQIKNKRLVFQKFFLGPFSGRGSISLESPYVVDGTIQFSGVQLNEFLSFWLPERKFDSSGKVNGTIRAQGPLGQLFLRAHLESQSGVIKRLVYDSMILNLEGVYPRMYISDSVFTEMEGMALAVSGPFDLSDSKSYHKQIQSLLIAPFVIKTDSSSDWTIRREGTSDTTITTFRNFLSHSDRLLGGGDGMIGVKKRISF